MRILRFACTWLFVIGTCLAQQSDKPRNIIILIGDGMGVSQVSASVLSFENNPFRRFTSTGFSVTCSADALITDSAAGATVLSTGYRTNNGYIGVGPDKKDLLNIFEIAEKLNLSTGVVVTSSVTHATPASFVAHEESRKYEENIAADFTDLDIDVAIGGGWGHFTTKAAGGMRLDSVNLLDKIKSQGYEYYNDEADFLAASPKNKFYALFEEDALPKACNRKYSLGELTSKAITKLNENSDGFILMVEGSQIDWGCHDNDEDYVLSELKDFGTALNAALDFAEKDGNTLVLVTADHETGGTAIVGGALNGNDIQLGFVSKNHTAAMVGVFAKGPGEELFRGIQNNFEIGRKLINLVDSNISFKK